MMVVTLAVVVVVVVVRVDDGSGVGSGSGGGGGDSSGDDFGSLCCTFVSSRTGAKRVDRQIFALRFRNSKNAVVTCPSLYCDSISILDWTTERGEKKLKN